MKEIKQEGYIELVFPKDYNKENIALTAAKAVAKADVSVIINLMEVYDLYLCNISELNSCAKIANAKNISFVVAAQIDDFKSMSDDQSLIVTPSLIEAIDYVAMEDMQRLLDQEWDD